MNRADFLGHISARLGRDRAPVEAPERDVIGGPEFWSEMHLSPDARLPMFRDKLTALGGDVRVVKDIPELQSELTTVFAQLGPKKVGIWNDPELREWLGQALTSHDKSHDKSHDVLTWGVDAPHEFTQTDVGITGATYAIADTGTLVLSCGGGRGRSVHLLPAVHLAVVGASQIRDRLGEALTELTSESLDSYIHFVTGPSRSSDIENDQSIGVHGPAAEIVIVVQAL